MSRFNCKIKIQVDKIPNKDELKKLGLKIWGNEYKQWDEFNLWVYLPDMDTNYSAYCLFEFSQNGLKSSEFFSKRKAGEKINSTNEIKKEFYFAKVDRKDNNSGFVDPFSLKPGEKWSISRETPLMPEIAPSNPMEALEKVKYIPAENYIIIVSVREKENNTWYAVEVLNQNNDLIDKGWINSIALIGQEIRLIHYKKVLKQDKEKSQKIQDEKEVVVSSNKNSLAYNAQGLRQDAIKIKNAAEKAWEGNNIMIIDEINIQCESFFMLANLIKPYLGKDGFAGKSMIDGILLHSEEGWKEHNKKMLETENMKKIHTDWANVFIYVDFELRNRK